MWPLILGAGIIALIANAFSGEEEVPKRKGKSSSEKKKVFISFAVEDKIYRDYLVKQSKLKKSPFSFIDMSVKEPWRNQVWQSKCRTKIKGSDAIIVLLSKNTWHAGGVHWEIKCAKVERVPLIGMHIKKDNKGAIPPGLIGEKIIDWGWDDIAKFTN